METKWLSFKSDALRIAQVVWEYLVIQKKAMLFYELHQKRPPYLRGLKSAELFERAVKGFFVKEVAGQSATEIERYAAYYFLWSIAWIESPSWAKEAYQKNDEVMVEGWRRHLPREANDDDWTRYVPDEEHDWAILGQLIHGFELDHDDVALTTRYHRSVRIPIVDEASGVDPRQEWEATSRQMRAMLVQTVEELYKRVSPQIEMTTFHQAGCVRFHNSMDIEIWLSMLPLANGKRLVRIAKRRQLDFHIKTATPKYQTNALFKILPHPAPVGV